jgi:hypothetical protein
VAEGWTMRIASALSSRRFRKGPLLTIGTIVVGALAAYEASDYVIREDFAGMAYAGIALVGGAIVIRILKNWRDGLYFFLAWLLFEDFARKFLGNNMAIFFAKDALVLILYFAFLAAFRRKEIPSFRPPFLVPLLIFIWFGLIQMFNPASTSIWYSLMGFKMYFYYVPLVFLGYALIDSEAQIRRFFKVNVALAVVIISLGIAQSILGPSFLNPKVPADDLRALSTLYRASPEGSFAYRPTSIFVSAGRYMNFTFLALLLVLGFGGYLLLRHKRGRILTFIAIAVTATGGFLTTSRGVFMWGMINILATSVAFIWGAPSKQGEVLRVFRGIQRALLAIALGIVLLVTAFPDALLTRLAIYEATLLPSSPTSELTYRGWDYPVRNFLSVFSYDRWPYGYGIGTCGLGSQYVTRIFKVKPPDVGVESGFGALVVEMGIGGLILWLVVSLAITASAWKIVKMLKGSPLFPVGFVIFWYAFFLLFPETFGGIMAYEDFLLNAYLWLLLGILFRLPSIAPSVQFGAHAPAQLQITQTRWVEDHEQ